MFKSKTIFLAAATSSLLLSYNANAESVLFSGVVTSSCVLVLANPGVLVANSGNTELGTAIAGGSAGLITTTTTGSDYEISVIGPSAFTVGPADANTNTSFTTTYSGTGTTSIIETLAGVSTPLDAGSTDISIDLTATKSTGAFSAGAYTAAATVTCE